MCHNSPDSERNTFTQILRDYYTPILTSLISGLILTVVFESIRILSGVIHSSLSEQIFQFSAVSFLLNVLIISLFVLFFRALLNRLSASLIIVSSVWGLFYFSHVQKYKILGKPFVLSDLSLLKELLNVSQTVVAGHWLLAAAVCISAAAVIAAIVFLLIRKSSFPLSPKVRIILGILSISPFISESFLHWQYSFIQAIDVQKYDHDYPCNLRTNGFALSLLLMNMRDVIEKPDNYHPEILQNSLNQFAEVQPASSNEGMQSDQQPDVVVYMGEAFWDVTLLPNVRFSTDPLPNFHKIAADPNTRQLNMITPSFGGATANVEFEVLTGFSTAFFPVSSVPYTQFIRNPIQDTIPKIFQSHNYRTLALHNFHGYFFSRMTVYPLIGFDDFICLEQLKNVDLEGRPAPETSEQNNRGIAYWNTHPVFIDGIYTSDEPLAYRLLQELNAESQQPKFIYAIGMVGHGPYLFRRWPQPDVNVSLKTNEEALTEQIHHELENLTNAVFRTDKAIGWIFDQLQKRKKKTILVIFGDHLPGISREAYAAAGFDEGQEEHRFYEMKVLIWANYPLPDIPAQDAFSAFYLGPKILRAAGLPLPPKLSLIESEEKIVPSMNPLLFRKTDGTWINSISDKSIDETQRNAVEILQSLAYEEFKR